MYMFLEMKKAGKTCIELGWLFLDRAGWRRFVGVLYSSGSEEDQVSEWVRESDHCRHSDLFIIVS